LSSQERKKIVAGISRVAEPVRLLHRLNSFWPRRQVLSLSYGLGWGVEILTRGPVRLLHGRASSYQSRFQDQKEKSSKLRNQNRKGSVLLFKVNERLTVTAFWKNYINNPVGKQG
jgi:hypothetical protein